MDVIETAANPKIAAQEIHSRRKILQAPMSFSTPAGFTQ